MDNGDLLHLVGDQKNSQLLRDLAVGAPLFKVIHQNFAQVFDHMPGVCVISFYEALDSNAMKENQNGAWKRIGKLSRFVAAEPATYVVPNDYVHNQIALDADHSNMIKYDNAFKDLFIIVLTKLKECVQNLKNASSSGIWICIYPSLVTGRFF
ncbi:hypothetical protein FPQ18DRAFT_49826 [Pyronema domesticum]|nr:hypothetical protein FPQ18DRAFT_49826 [Pyronema domesticum]